MSERAQPVQAFALRELLPDSKRSKPVLKWLGGKRWLLRMGLQVPVLEGSSRYFEPFAGAASLFFAMGHSHTVLGDANPELMDTYLALQTDLERVISQLKRLRNTPAEFERVRRMRPRTLAGTATRFIYLNRTAYGGVYRVNRLGQFNTPYGHYVGRRVCQEAELRGAAAALAGVALVVGDFERTAATAKEGDFVYFDPPYGLGGTETTFNRYTRGAFDLEAHQRLADVAHTLRDRGVHVLVSNSSSPEIVDLYSGFHATFVKRENSLSRDPIGRRPFEEALYSTYEGVLG